MNDNFDDDRFIISDEEQQAFMEWWDANIPKKFITLLNQQKYDEAVKAIDTIVSIVSSCCDEDEMPKFDVNFDKMFATNLGLDIVVTQFGMNMLARQLGEITKVLPEDCIITAFPKTDCTTLIAFTFRNIKEVIATEDNSDIPKVE